MQNSRLNWLFRKPDVPVLGIRCMLFLRMTSKLAQSIFRKCPDFEEFIRTNSQHAQHFKLSHLTDRKQLKAFLVLAESSVKRVEILTDWR